MKKHTIMGMIIILLGMMFIGYHSASANLSAHKQQKIPEIGHLLAAPTLIPTAEPILVGYPTPEARVLPPVGSNAGLVIGAIVLVLIIIGGVLSARLREKH